MKDKIFMILLGIIAVNLTIQTVKDVGIFPTAYAQVGSGPGPSDKELLALESVLRDFIDTRFQSLQSDLIFYTRNIQ